MPSAPCSPSSDDVTKWPPHRYDGCDVAWNVDGLQDLLLTQLLKAYGYELPDFVDVAADTKFADPTRGIRLSAAGRDYMPPCPKESNEVTKDPLVTTFTELLAKLAVEHHVPGIVVPHSRALHQEWPGVQHHGIDFIGIFKDGGKNHLVIVEVMATTEGEPIPSTVYQHRKQLHETLNEPKLLRLMTDLNVVHRETGDGDAKHFLAKCIRAILKNTLGTSIPVVAIPVLVRKSPGQGPQEWKPFKDKLAEFEKALAPAHVRFQTLVLPGTYEQAIASLMDGGAK